MTIYKGSTLIAGGGLPTQAGKSGKYLKTNGTLASWEDLEHDNTKQDVIQDLEEIRAGAAKGATAVQDLSDLGITATAQEINVLDGITASTTELNYVDGVTSNVQTQLNNKVDKTTTASKIYGTDTSGNQTTITYASNNTASTVVLRDANSQINVAQTPTANLHATSKAYVDSELSKKITSNAAITGATHTKITYDSKGLVTSGSDIVIADVTDLTSTASEINELHSSGVVKADLQKLHNLTATDTELNTLHGITSTTEELNQIHGSGVLKADLQKLHNVTATATELNYVDGVTSNIQDQLDGKSTVSVSETGTSSDEVRYITIDGVEKKLAADETIYTGGTGIDITDHVVTNLVSPLVPSQASESNQLADKAFVNSSVQSAAANFRGNWTNWASVPTDSSLYPVDYTGSTIPTVNDYMVVQDPEDYRAVDPLKGTWRFKYSGVWATDGKNGWLPEYKMNDEPMTAAQLAALNSGITSSLVEQIGINESNIETKQDKLVSGTNIKTVNNTSLLGSGNVAVQSVITGAATTITDNNLIVSRALVSDASGKVAVSDITSTELGYLDGVEGNIQEQLNAKTNDEDLADVAKTGSYNDLTDTPNIPTVTDSITQGSTEALSSGGAFTNVVTDVTQAGDANKFTVKKAGVTNTITIDNVGNATTASKLGSSTIGSTTTPIYLSGGTATPISYTIAKSVPADAEFTDTTYEVFTGATASTAGTSGLVKKPNAGDQNKFLKGNGNWETVNALPTQTGSAGKYLTTDGTTASWDELATVANTGSYNDLSNKPTIPAAQVNSDWEATSGVAQILNKPTIPVVPINVSAFTNDANYQTDTQVNTAISTHDTSTTAHSDIRSAVASKSTVSVSATGTATDEVQYITIDGVQKKLAGSGSSAIEEDNITITKNASGKIQASGTIDNNTNATTPVYDWVGTLAEYEEQAIATTHPTWICYITDDVDTSILNSVYTKAETDGLLATMLSTIYPVGSIYIGTQASCPMSALISGSTWELVSAGRTLQGADSSHAAGSTIEAGLPNITTVFDGMHWSSAYNTNSIPLTSNNGVMYNAGNSVGYDHLRKSEGQNWIGKKIGFDASKASSIYGKSSTVQPPAYVVNIWRRTA